jgi:hypothetical protein
MGREEEERIERVTQFKVVNLQNKVFYISPELYLHFPLGPFRQALET